MNNCTDTFIPAVNWGKLGYRELFILKFIITSKNKVKKKKTVVLEYCTSFADKYSGKIPLMFGEILRKLKADFYYCIL